MKNGIRKVWVRLVYGWDLLVASVLALIISIGVLLLIGFIIIVVLPMTVIGSVVIQGRKWWESRKQTKDNEE